MPVFPDYQAQEPLPVSYRKPDVNINAGAVESGMKQIGAGLGEAATYAEAYQQRAQQKEAYNTGLSFEQLNQQLANQHDELVRNQAPGAEGLYQAGADALNKTTDEWLKTVPPALQQEYAQKTAILAEKYHGAYANAEAEGRRSWEKETTITSLPTDQNQAARAWLTNKDMSTVDAIVKDRLALIDKTTLLPEQKLALKTTAERAIRESVAKVMTEQDAAKTLGQPGYGAATDSPDGVFNRMLTLKENPQGDPAAKSPKGALGLAQIMPDTARETAKAIGVTLPAGSDADLRTYFATPEGQKVNLQLGKAYFDQQLQTFGGDTEAAVIAYNAGPGVAQKWLAEGRSNTALPKETISYRDTVLGGSGHQAPPAGGMPRANYMSVGERFGDPNTYAFVPQHITTIQAPNGEAVQVNKESAAAFQGFLGDLAASGYKIDSVGGFNVRNIRGSTTISQHSFGNAIDVNPNSNPLGGAKSDLPANVSQLAAKWGLVWGGDFKGRKDPMHFEYGGGGQAQGGQGSGPPPAPDPRYDIFTPEEREAMFNSVRTQTSQQQAIARSDLEPRVQDATSALLATGSYGGTPITRQNFDAAYGPEQGGVKYAQFQRVQEIGQKVDGMKIMTPDAIAGMVNAAKPVDNGPGFAQQQTVYETLQKAAAANMEARKDSATYAGSVFPAVAQARQDQTPGGFAKALQLTAEAERRLAIPEDQQKLLPSGTAAQLAQGILKANDPKAAMDQLEQQSGAAWPRVFSELVSEGKLPTGYQALSILSPTEASYLAMALKPLDPADGGKGASWADRLGKDAANKEVYSVIKETVGANASIISLRNSMHLQGVPDNTIDSMVKDVETLAAAHVWYDRADAAAASTTAVKAFTDQYAFLPIENGGARVPVASLPAVAANIATTLHGLTPDTIQVPSSFGNKDFMGNAMGPAKEDYISALKAAPVWVNTPGADGVTLLFGGRYPVLDAAGKPVTVLFNQGANAGAPLQQTARSPRGGGGFAVAPQPAPAAIPATPATPPAQTRAITAPAPTQTSPQQDIAKQMQDVRKAGPGDIPVLGLGTPLNWPGN